MASEASVSEADKVNGVSDDNTEKQGDERDMLIRSAAAVETVNDFIETELSKRKRSASVLAYLGQVQRAAYYRSAYDKIREGDDFFTLRREKERQKTINADLRRKLDETGILVLESRVKTLENEVKAITAELCDAQSELKLVKDTRDKYRDLYARFAKKCEELMIKLNETETARNVAEGDRERLQAFLTACCDEHNQDAYSLGVKLSRSRENYKALQGSLSLARSEVNRLERRVEELEEEVRNYRTRCELAKSVHEFEAEAQQESFDGEMNSLLKAKDIQIDREIRRADRAAQEATLLKIHCYGKERGMPHYSPSFSEALQEMEAIDAEIDRIDPAYATWKNRLKFHSDFERDGTVTHVNGDEREVTTQTMSSLRDDNRPTTD